jgi:hypothetical protein
MSPLPLPDMRSTPKLIEARPLSGYRAHVRFDDGVGADVDLSDLLVHGGVFEPLSDHAFFSRLVADPEAGTIVWPNGADIAPESLYERAKRHASTTA